MSETHESPDTGLRTFNGKKTNVTEEKNVNRALCVSESGEIIKSCFKFFFRFGIYFRNYCLLKSNSDLWGRVNFVSFGERIEFNCQK